MLMSKWVGCFLVVLSGEIPKYTVYIVQHPDMAAAFEAVQPCENTADVCVATDINPPQCLRQGETVALQQLTPQQKVMDKACQEAMDAACRDGTRQEHCYGLWLARHDIGSGGNGGPAWRCYPESELLFGKLSKCVDGCGNLILCRGAPARLSPHSVELPQLKTIAADPSFCSSYQKAGNAFCEKRHGPNSVARQNCNTSKWMCFKTVSRERGTGCRRSAEPHY